MRIQKSRLDEKFLDFKHYELNLFEPHKVHIEGVCLPFQSLCSSNSSGGWGEVGGVAGGNSGPSKYTEWLHWAFLDKLALLMHAHVREIKFLA